MVIAGVPTTTTLVSTDANPSVANNTMTLVATVTPNQVCNPLAPCPTGAAPGRQSPVQERQYHPGNGDAGPGREHRREPTSTAVLTLARNTLAGNSSNSITATYIPNGTGDYLASTSAPLAITVGAGTGALNTNISLSTTPANATNFVDTSDVIFVATVSNTVWPPRHANRHRDVLFERHGARVRATGRGGDLRRSDGSAKQRTAGIASGTEQHCGPVRRRLRRTRLRARPTPSTCITRTRRLTSRCRAT